MWTLKQTREEPGETGGTSVGRSHRPSRIGSRLFAGHVLKPSVRANTLSPV